MSVVLTLLLVVAILSSAVGLLRVELAERESARLEREAAARWRAANPPTDWHDRLSAEDW